MSESLEHHLQHPVFAAIAKAAKQLDQPVYVVGGFVRDLLLQRPCKDIDIVTVGDGLILAEQAARLLKPSLTVSTFKNFGTAHFNYEEYDVEFVGARKESYSRDSRNPVVEAGTLEDDQNRRDFTINALAISLNESNFGELIDPFDGLADLNQKLIRTPLEPADTFSDDPLRMMRAIRFSSQLNFRIDEITYAGIEESAQRIKIVSAERITDELNKIILSPVPSIGFKLLFNTRILHIIFPELVKLHGVEFRDGKGHKDNFYHTLKVLDNVAEVSNDLWLRWAALLHDIAKPATKAFDEVEGWTFHGHEFLGMKMVKPIFRRMRLPLDQKLKYVQKLVQLHLRPIALTKEIVTDSAVRRLIFDAGDDLEDLLTLCRCDITSRNQEKVERFKRNLGEVEKKVRDVEERDRIRNFQPVVDGQEIMDLFGLSPSREVGLLKNALKDAVLDGIIRNNREEAINFVVEKGRELGLQPVN
ncbi:MAG: HD domain-containing protein [Flavobacteriales bacterium]|nr:HD domain-containing protein [Bacteroidota bacterium]MCB9239598.1 HD domain-containing protein [Flavobacteriales bacterium]